MRKIYAFICCLLFSITGAMAQDWGSYIVNNDPQPFVITLGETSVTITPKDLTTPYYVIAASDENNNRLWSTTLDKSFVAQGGYTEVSNEAIWEWKLRDWATKNDLLTGEQTFPYSSFGLMTLAGSGDYTIVVAHCNGAGWKSAIVNGYWKTFYGESDAYRTSNFCQEKMTYTESFKITPYFSMADSTFACRPSDAEQEYLIITFAESERNGKSNQDLWEEAVNTSGATFVTGEQIVSLKRDVPGWYNIVAGGVKTENGRYVLYGNLMSRSWEVDEPAEENPLVTSLSVNIAGDKVTVIPNKKAESATYALFLASKKTYKSAEEAFDILYTLKSDDLLYDNNTVALKDIKGYVEGENAYYLFAIGAQMVKNQCEATSSAVVIELPIADLNEDGRVDVADVTTLVNLILNNDSSKGDINGDGTVDVADVTALVNIILNN